MKTIKIFLASSEELKQDRDAFRQFISVENDRLHKKDIYLEITDWEYGFSALATRGTQEVYNSKVRESDIVVCLFYTKAGPYTQQEFDAALEEFLKTGKPLIYTYFKNPGPDDKETKSLKAFKKRLFHDLKHFYDKYDSIADLQNQFRRQLDLIGERGFIQFKEDKKLTAQDEINQYIKKYRLKKIRQFAAALAVVAITAFITIKIVGYLQDKEPFNLKVHIENKTPNPELPGPVGRLLLTYDPKTETKDSVRIETIFESIPGQFRGDSLRLQFMADGFVAIDTMVVACEKLVILPVLRNDDLALLTGTIMSADGQPLEGVRVSIDCCSAYTDLAGQFRLPIPFEHQREQQRLSLFKEGYKKIDITTPVIPGGPVRQILYRN
jgi:hypothetical protein